MTLPERLVALHRALARHRIPHAFGGAIALAYWTLDPRATSDIDVNVFLPAADAAKALRALPPEVAQPAGSAEVVERDGQIRLWWDETPIDLFFDTIPVQVEAARHRERVDFARTQIPVLGPVELAVFKAMFDRTRDWADIEAMLVAEQLDLDAVRETLQTVFAAGDHRFARLEEALRQARMSA
jgi:Nucleotidyl transferase AbiEii toxin, Type IV TA system